MTLPASPPTKTTTTQTDAPRSRRRFITGAALTTAAAASTLAFPHVARAQTRVIKMQGAWGGGIFREFALDYVNRVNRLADGSMRIDYLDVGAVVKTAEIQNAVDRGVVDAGHLVTAYWYSKNPAASLFGTGPCWGWGSNEVIAWIKYGGGKALYEELVNDILNLNLVGFFSGPMPAQPLGWFRETVNGPSDLQGLKYRTVGLAANVMQSLGMSVAQLPGGEILPALERGLIDAAEFNNPSSDKDFGLQDVAKNYYLGSFHQSQEMFEIIFNRDLFNSLTETQRNIIEIASEAASADMSWKSQGRYSDDLASLAEDFGVNVHRTPTSIMAAQLDAWDEVLTQFTVNPFFARVVESQKAWVKKVAFYQLNNSPDYQTAYNHYFG